jgi:hypothetical protein
VDEALMAAVLQSSARNAKSLCGAQSGVKRIHCRQRAYRHANDKALAMRADSAAMSD